MRVFITGITGTLGTALAEAHHRTGDVVFGCSRGESRVVEWMRARPGVATIYLSDACHLHHPSDAARVLPSMDRLYHCAAMKHVDVCEAQPQEAVRQNVDCITSLAVRCEELGVPMVSVSSDKACLPQGVYGATKLIGERVALAHGAAVVRLGNLIASSGSVFAVWGRAVAEGWPVKVTGRETTSGTPSRPG
jgi:FlaA1/EpsC-like NDP-sugar epimerase